MYSENGLPSVTPWRGNSTHRAQAHVQSWAPAGGAGTLCAALPVAAAGPRPEAQSTGPCVWLWNDALLVSPSLPHAHKPKPCEMGGEARAWAPGAGRAWVSHTGRSHHVGSRKGPRAGGAVLLPSPEKQMPPTGPQRARRPRTHSGCRMTSSYKAFCRLDRRHFNTCSYFFVSCFSTSLLVLLRIKGCVTWGNTAAAACPWRHARRRPAPRPPPRPHVPCAGV